MKLTSLDPEWIGLLRSDSGEGVAFTCPTCSTSHRLAAYFVNPLDGQAPAAWHTQTWLRDGETFESLTVSPSIQYPCFHGWIERGKVFITTQSPLVVVGEGKIIALSPLQTILVAQRAFAQATAMLA